MYVCMYVSIYITLLFNLLTVLLFFKRLYLTYDQSKHLS